MSNGTEECPHGHMRRRCDVCDLEAQVKELEPKAKMFDTLMQALRALEPHRHNPDGAITEALLDKVKRVQELEEAVLVLAKIASDISGDDPDCDRDFVTWQVKNITIAKEAVEKARVQ